uniref:MAPK-interacting and spindle-stabilizing protein-like n=1 Tax=Castor canadensis TaxID=51338 RepID=A0A8B7WIF2_CASCN|nr:MAPK-interacting and spindle-stabilizing protein-like [Castor canadensis]
MSSEAILAPRPRHCRCVRGAVGQSGRAPRSLLAAAGPPGARRTRGPPGLRSPQAVTPLRPPLQYPRPAPALTLRGLKGAAAGRGEATPGLPGERQRLVQAPSLPLLGPAASAAGSGGVTPEQRRLFPWPFPYPLRLSTSPAFAAPPRPASPKFSAPRFAGVYSRRPGPPLCPLSPVLHPAPARPCWGCMLRPGAAWRNA